MPTTLSEQERRASRVFEQTETIEAWDDDYYHPIAEKYYDRAITSMLRHLHIAPNAVVLDAGCGPGTHSIRVAQAGHRVYCVDFSDAMLTAARARVGTAGLSERVTFQREDLTRLSFEDESFDFVFSWGVIIHIREIEKALDELCRIVRPGGRLALYVTNRSAWDHKLEALARSVVRKPLGGLEHLPMGDGTWYTMHGEQLWVWRIDAASLTSYVEAHGFQLTHHVIGEMTEVQRRLRGLPRRLLLHFNNLCYRLKLSPRHSATNLFVFQKTV
jgi:SAM-dependent methyltransferase